MAFLSRANRFTNYVQGETEDIGPGQYIKSEMEFKSYSQFNAAPFSSTSKREITHNKTGDSFVTPGPGAYENVHNKKSIPHRYCKETSNFKSVTRRFNEKQEFTPGPGKYNPVVEKKIIKNAPNFKKIKEDGISWVKINTTPSIPSGNDCQFINNEKGDLIKNKTKISKTKISSIGPGEYNISDSMGENNKKYKGISSFKSKTKRSTFSRYKKNIPGPGHYANMEKNENEPYKFTSSFSSTTKRGDWVKLHSDQKKVPGPGHYKSSLTSFKNEKIPERFQNFGSSCIRPINSHEGVSSRVEVTPGPGHFINETSTIKKPKYSHGGFSSGEKRFKGNGNDENLGPGSYDIRGTMESSVRRKRKLGSFGVFGTTSKRFIRNTPKNITPGVGTYKILDLGKREKKEKSSPIFQSTSKRMDTKLEKVNGPGPGSYNIIKQEKYLKKKKLGFVSRSKRFNNRIKKKNVPGPGLYDISSGFDLISKKRDYRRRSLPNQRKREVRRKRDKKWYNQRDAPGPGSYNLDQQWGSKTYNVTSM